MKSKFARKMMKKSFLTAAVCLAFSEAAFAMPTGGEVTHGDVTGITNGTIASGGTVNVNSTAIINWNDFGIANGETLNFALGSNSLLNRVTGGNISEIFGALNVTGSGNWALVNPNSITIGTGAIIGSMINPVNLTFSTLAITDQQFLAAVDAGDRYLAAWSTPEGRTKPAAININEAQIEGGNVDLFGGSINLDTIIEEAQTNEVRANAVAKTVEVLADNTDVDTADKDRCVAGFVLSIAHSSLTQEAKQELVQAVSDNYKPVTTLLDDKIQEDDSAKKLIEAGAEQMAASATALAGDAAASEPVVTGVE